jgi:hypothetical protein
MYVLKLHSIALPFKDLALLSQIPVKQLVMVCIQSEFDLPQTPVYLMHVCVNCVGGEGCARRFVVKSGFACVWVRYHEVTRVEPAFHLEFFVSTPGFEL